MLKSGETSPRPLPDNWHTLCSDEGARAVRLLQSSAIRTHLATLQIEAEPDRLREVEGIGAERAGRTTAPDPSRRP